MCKKLAYDSEQSAIKQGRKKSGHAGGRIRAYRCAKCEHWHTTTKEKQHTMGSDNG